MGELILIFIGLIIIVRLYVIAGKLDRIIRIIKPKKKLHLVFYKLTNDSLTIKKGVTMVGLTKTQKVTIQVKAFDNSEPPVEAPLENIVFVSSDEAICTVVQDETDPSKAVIFAHADGVAQVDVSADGDLGEGTLELNAFLGVEVQTLFASSLGIEPGVPEEQ